MVFSSSAGQRLNEVGPVSVRSIALIVFAAAAMASCSPAPTGTPSPSNPVATAFSIRTPAQEPQACMEALMQGRLVRQAQTGLGIGDQSGLVYPVEWPFRFTARLEGARVVLVDNRGAVVAREGDQISVGGGMGPGPGPNAVWFACGPVQVTQPG